MTDHHFLREGSWAYRPLRWLEALIDHAAPVLLTSSQHAANLLKQTFEVPEERIYPTPDCVNADTFSPLILSGGEREGLKRDLGVPLDKQVIVYLGLLAEYQGTGLLLEALSQLRRGRADFHLLLMGFPNVEVYRARATALGLGQAVTFTGPIPYEDAPATWRWAISP